MSLDDRPIPEEWREEWTCKIADPPDTATSGSKVSLLVFRTGREWFSIPVDAVLEIGRMPVVHSLPHRSGVVSGVVNVRGRVVVCFSFHALLSPLPGPQATDPRLIVFRKDGWVTAAQADAVDAVISVEETAISPLPPPHDSAPRSLTNGLWTSGQRTIAHIDEALFFQAIREALA